MTDFVLLLGTARLARFTLQQKSPRAGGYVGGLHEVFQDFFKSECPFFSSFYLDMAVSLLFEFRLFGVDMYFLYRRWISGGFSLFAFTLLIASTRLRAITVVLPRL